MFSLKFVLVAILIFLGCALAQSLQGEALAREVAESTQLDEVKEESARWRWHDADKSENDNEREAEKEAEREEETQKSSRAPAFPPCQPPRGSSSTSKSSSSSASSASPSTPSPSSSSSSKSSSSSSSKSSSTSAKSSSTSAKSSSTSAKSATTASGKSATTGRPATTGKSASSSSTSAKSSSSTTAKSATSSSSGSNYGLCDIVPATVEPLKMLLPLYVYPGSSWDQIVTAASKIDIIAIINPNSGPGSSASSTYVTYMNRLDAAGVEQIGYVYTSYGDRAISAVKADIDTYKNKFPHINGIFFDEASNSASDISYYGELYNYVLSKGFTHSILNPGVVPAQGYVDISTNIVVFEDYGSSVNSKSYSSFVKCAPSASQKAGYKYKFSGIAHTTSTSNFASYIERFQNSGMGLVYVTDGAGGCCTYNNMVSYFSAEVSSIQSMNN